MFRTVDTIEARFVHSTALDLADAMNDQSGNHRGRAGSVVGNSTNKRFAVRGLYRGDARHRHAGLAVDVTSLTTLDTFQGRLTKLDSIYGYESTRIKF